MRSVTEELTGEAPAGVPESATFNADNREKLANAKLKLAFATRTKVPAATGVGFSSPGHAQMQEIFDDGSVRNPYRANREMSGRQRRKMRKVANRNMKARGLSGKIQDVLKGRRVGEPARPQPATEESPAPGTQAVVPVGPPFAAHSSD